MSEKNQLENNFNPPWETKQVLLTFLITFFLFIGFSFFLGSYLRYLNSLGLVGKMSRSDLVNSVWGDLLMLFYFVILGFVVYFFILQKIKGSKIKFFIDSTKFKDDLVYAVGIYAISFLGAFILGFFIVIGIIAIAVLVHKDPFKAIEIYSQGLDIERAQITAHLGLVKVIMLIFFAPIFEEVFFRGCLYGALRKSHGIFFSIVISSCLFALMHGYIFNLLYIFFMGIMGAWLYEKRRSLTSPIFFHFLWNLMVFFMTIFGKSRGNVV